ncbi:MAG: GDP-mannose 4,6-dehydratase [Planctomycetota bacterium]|nr:GDP-mannose 4,6-dehydratase [Planctomycetota bacterium]
MTPQPATPLRHVLLTGAAGFIGSHLTERLLLAGCAVTGIDNFDPYYLTRDKRENLGVALAHPGFRLLQADLRDRAALDRALAEHGPFDAVAHLAARAGVRASFEDPKAYEDLNLGGTRVLLEALDARDSAANLVFGSSSSVYGDSAGPFREDQPLGEPLSPYAATKQACERHLEAVHRRSGREISIMRLFTVYGPRQRPDMAIPRFAARLLRGEAVEIYGDGASLRDYTYVSDIVDGLVRALSTPAACRSYNLGSNSPVRLDDMLARLAAVLDRAPRAEHVVQPPGDAALTWASIDRARTELGWEPRVSFEEGLRRSAGWLRARHGADQAEREA